MRLNDPLIDEITYKNKVYKLDLAFDNVLDVFDVLNSTDFTDYEKLDVILEYLTSFDETEEYADFKELEFAEQLELYSEIMNNHIAANDEHFVERDVLGEVMTSDSEKVIDFELDAKFIFASFFALGINLFEQQGKLHWAEFQALLQALPDDSIMSKIIRIRQWEESKGETAEYKAEMRRLQEKYSLKKVGEAIG